MSSEVACQAVALCEGLETSLDYERMRDLIRSLPVRSAFGLPVYVAASQAAPFSTEPVLSEVERLGMTLGR